MSSGRLRTDGSAETWFGSPIGTDSACTTTSTINSSFYVQARSEPTDGVGPSAVTFSLHDDSTTGFPSTQFQPSFFEIGLQRTFPIRRHCSRPCIPFVIARDTVYIVHSLEQLDTPQYCDPCSSFFHGLFLARSAFRGHILAKLSRL